MTTTLQTTTPARKSRKTQTRSLRVIARPVGENPGKLAITVDGIATEYAYTCDPVGDGIAYGLESDKGDVYIVMLSPTKGNSCGCKGFARWNRCKHVSGLLALTMRDATRPTPAPAPVCSPTTTTPPAMPAPPAVATSVIVAGHNRPACNEDGDGYTLAAINPDTGETPCPKCAGLGFVRTVSEWGRGLYRCEVCEGTGVEAPF